MLHERLKPFAHTTASTVYSLRPRNIRSRGEKITNRPAALRTKMTKHTQTPHPTRSHPTYPSSAKNDMPERLHPLMDRKAKHGSNPNHRLLARVTGRSGCVVCIAYVAEARGGGSHRPVCPARPSAARQTAPPRFPRKIRGVGPPSSEFSCGSRRP